MEASTAIVPVISVCLFFVVFYKAVKFFITQKKVECEYIATCPPSMTKKCREGDKAVIACIAAASILFILAQVLDWITKGFIPVHDAYMHVWHGYDFFTAVTWLLFVYHLRARSIWRSPR